MRKALALVVLLLATGCGYHVNTQVNKVTVDGVDCIKAQSSRGIAISCNWPLKVDTN